MTYVACHILLLLTFLSVFTIRRNKTTAMKIIPQPQNGAVIVVYEIAAKNGIVAGRSYYLQRGELNLVAPLATVIKQRVRCTEAKLIWGFDDKRTTFIPLSHRLDGYKKKEAPIEKVGKWEVSKRLENDNFGYIYCMSTLVPASNEISPPASLRPAFTWRQISQIWRPLKQQQSHAIRSDCVSLLCHPEQRRVMW